MDCLSYCKCYNKKCDKSFFDGNSTGLPKKDVCDFFGIDYTFRKKEIVIIFNEKKYRGYLMTKNDSSNRSILAWYQELGRVFKKYYSNNLVFVLENSLIMNF